jgi:hypothetical protein
MFGLAVGNLLSVDEVDAELGGDDHPVPDRLERLTDKVLVARWSIDVDLSGIEEG